MSHPERPQEEFNPTSRWIELSLPDGTPERKIIRIANRVVRYLFESPEIPEGNYAFFGTRTLVLVSVTGDRSLSPNDILNTSQAREMRFVRRVLAAGDTPHADWLIVPIDHESI